MNWRKLGGLAGLALLYLAGLIAILALCWHSFCLWIKREH